VFHIKKTTCVCAAALVCLLLLSSCFAGDTTTDHARNHVYTLGEVIRFYDEKNDRDLLGTLTFVSVHVLSEDEFTLREKDGTDKEGEPVYKDVTYRQIVQINYTYQSITGRRLRAFSVHDAAGSRGALDPDTAYETIPVEPGVSSLVAALPDRGRSVRVEVYYTGVFSPNVIASLAIGKEVSVPVTAQPTVPPTTTAPTTAEQANTSQYYTQTEPQPDIALLEARLDEQRQSILILDAQLNKKQGQITALTVLLTTVSCILLMLLWQMFRNRKKH